MTGYVGEYGEGFLGVGYSHSSFANASADGTMARSETAEAGSDNGFSYYGPGESDASDICFVAATRMDHSKRIEPDTSGPGQQKQQQRQQPQNNTIEEEAKLARSKAMDIVRNILHGDGKPSSRGTCRNQPPEILSNDQAYGYYGPSASSASNAYTSQSEPSTAGAVQSLPSAASIESDAQARRLEAMKVLQKFQQQPPSTVSSAAVPSLGQSREPPFPNAVQYYGSNDTQYIQIEEPRSMLRVQSHGQPHHQSLLPPATIPSPTPSPTPPKPPGTPPWEMARKRRECLDRHEERKQGALFKNLEYVARLEEERLRQQLHQVKQVQTLEAQIDDMYRQKLAFRQQQQQQQQTRDGRNSINTSAAGIGTKERQKAERKRRRTALPPSLRKQYSNNTSNNNNSNGNSSVAIYVSNLPTDGSVNDSTIEALFASYGSLRKVHFYVDKTNGKRKGDALVLYSLNSDGDDNEAARLTEAVCSQVCTTKTILITI